MRKIAVNIVKAALMKEYTSRDGTTHKIWKLGAISSSNTDKSISSTITNILHFHPKLYPKYSVKSNIQFDNKETAFNCKDTLFIPVCFYYTDWQRSILIFRES